MKCARIPADRCALVPAKANRRWSGLPIRSCDEIPGKSLIAACPRGQRKRPMIFKPVVAGVVLALILGASGCEQIAPSRSVAPSPPGGTASTAMPAESHATAPAGSARSPRPAEAAGREVGEVLGRNSSLAPFLWPLFSLRPGIADRQSRGIEISWKYPMARDSGRNRHDRPEQKESDRFSLPHGGLPARIRTRPSLWSSSMTPGRRGLP